MILFLLGAAWGAAFILILVMAEKRFRKPNIDHYHASLELAIGKSSLTLTNNDVPMVKVILTKVTRSSEGSSAEFEDYYRYTAARTIR